MEKYKQLTGNQKKMLVLDTLTKIINENIDNEVEKQELLSLITTEKECMDLAKSHGYSDQQIQKLFK